MERPNRQGIQFTGNYIIIFRYIPDTSQRKTPAQDVTRQHQSGVDSDSLVMRNYQYSTVCFRIAVQPYNLGMFTMKSEHCKSQVGVRCRFDSCHLHQKRKRIGSSRERQRYTSVRRITVLECKRRLVVVQSVSTAL